MTVCPHGHDENTLTPLGDDGITLCCDAYSSIFTDDGTEYCKCCYGTVSHTIAATTIPDRRPA